MPKTNADCVPMPPAASACDAVVGLYDVPPIWGHVLDYLPYAMMSVALSAVHEDVQEEVELAITTLNLTEAEQLDAPSTGGGRFSNVEEINCLSFLCAAEDSPPDARGDDRILAVCRETATRLVPFLATFPQLRLLYVGGGFVESDGEGIERLIREEYWYHGSPMSDDFHPVPGSANNRNQLRNPANFGWASSFGHQFIGALKARVFPSLESTESISSLLEYILCPPTDTSEISKSKDAKDMCANCRDICAHFPVADIVSTAWRSSCVENIVVFEAIAARDGAKMLLGDPDSWCSMWMAETVFLDIPRFTLGGVKTSADQDKVELRDRLLRLGADTFRGEVVVEFLKKSSCTFIDRVIAVGWRPATMSMYRNGSHDYFDNWPIAKTTFDFLVSRGFPLKKSKCIVVDEKIEPALRELNALISTDYLTQSQIEHELLLRNLIT